MNKVNYQKELDKLIEKLEQTKEVPRLFLHSCCAPCSSYVLEYLSEHFAITVFYFNPNIAPEEEYRKRVEEQKRLIEQLPAVYPIQFLEGRYEPEEFYSRVRGLEKEPEGGARCRVCFELRLEEAARLAAEGGYDYYTTTLSISPLKNAQVLAQVAMEMGEKWGVAWLPSDFKKKEGYKRSIQLSSEYDLYRQNYCGCVFSRQKEE
ncbi:MAG: epoxyqueuosine reductase QueH [Lachnospiraceae bacterium]|nr:epoxyqueuosine reductase QueH [Lachnospiraceae bacterium]MDY4771267.1 epoxyqueuosine reductase QueH [Lachnospiraceae bacterium]